MDILWLKLISVPVIFTIGLFAGIIPTRKVITSKGKQGLILGNAFAGGIFLGAGLIHLLPDSIENFNTLAGKVDFPFPTLIAGIGFLFILFLDKAASKGQDHHEIVTKKEPIFPFILYLVLSIHSIIAGASLGLEGSLLSTITLFIAIIAHKGAASFALGVSLKKNGIATKRHIITIAFFAMMTPLGIIIGTIFTSVLSSNTSILFEMIFDALAAGTFLYIAIAEIIGEIFEKRTHIWSKLLLISAGFGLMAMIAIWA